MEYKSELGIPFLPPSPALPSHSLVLEMLYAAQTLELPVHHDGQPSAQSLTLLHTEGKEREGAGKGEGGEGE